MLDPAASAESKDLPIRIYESVVLTVREVPAVDFVRASFTLEAEETERVVVDHVAKTSGSSNDGTVAAVVSPFAATLAAVKALQQRIRVLILYLSDVATSMHSVSHLPCFSAHSSFLALT
jgi:hypothetical protein